MRYRRPRAVAAVSQGGVVYVADVFHGPIVVLEGSAALIWEAAVAVEADRVVEELAAATGADPDLIRPEADAFLADMLARGLLSACEPGSSAEVSAPAP